MIVTVDSFPKNCKYEIYRNHKIFCYGYLFYIVRIDEEKTDRALPAFSSSESAIGHINYMVKNNPFVKNYRGYGIYDFGLTQFRFKKVGTIDYEKEYFFTVEQTQQHIDKLLMPSLFDRILSIFQ